MWSTAPCCESVLRWTCETWSGSSPTPLFQGGGPFCSPDSCAKLTSNGFVEPPPSAVASTITTTIARAAAPPPIHQRFGPDSHPAAWARPFARTGGGVRACASRRLRLLCLPLGIQRLCTRHTRRILLNGSWYRIAPRKHEAPPCVNAFEWRGKQAGVARAPDLWCCLGGSVAGDLGPLAR